MHHTMADLLLIKANYLVWTETDLIIQEVVRQEPWRNEGQNLEQVSEEEAGDCWCTLGEND